MKKALLKKLGAAKLKGRYRCITAIGEGKNSRSYFGIDLKTGQEVFIKMLLFPRSDFEIARFENEIYFLGLYGQYDLFSRHIPKLIDHGLTFGGEVRYMVQGKIMGQLLSDWLVNNLPTADFEARLEIFHRVVVALTGHAGDYEHRDLHPGNILIEEGAVDWHEVMITSNVKIVDWGQAFSELIASHHKAPDFMSLLRDRINKEITRSFYTIPPETFMRDQGGRFNLGAHDAWSLGLLFYKLLTGKDLLEMDGIGSMAQSVHDGSLHRIIGMAQDEVEHLDKGRGMLLKAILGGLLELDPKKRMHPSTASRIIWDIRIEEFIPDNPAEAKKYLAHPGKYKGPWKFSSEPDYY